jgi:hypothetical protein
MNTTAPLRVVASMAVLAGSAFLASAAYPQSEPAGPVVTYATADETRPPRFQFERWMDSGRRAVARGWAGYARRHFAAAMQQAWLVVPADHLVFEDLGDGLAGTDLLPEAAFCYQQALDVLKGMKDADVAKVGERIDRKLNVLPPSARQTMRPLVPAPESKDELSLRRTAVPLDVTLVAFYRELVTAPADRQRNLVAAALPTLEDVRVLFPERADAVWAIVDKTNRSILAGAADLAKGAKEAGPVQGVLTIPLSGENKAGFEEALALASPSAALVNATLIRAGGETPVGVYAWVNSHWVWLRDLADLSAALQPPK